MDSIEGYAISIAFEKYLADLQKIYLPPLEIWVIVVNVSQTIHEWSRGKVWQSI